MAACIRAETGVGPSIASEPGMKKICADFPIAPMNKSKQIKSIALSSTPKKISFLIIVGICSKTSE